MALREVFGLLGFEFTGGAGLRAADAGVTKVEKKLKSAAGVSETFGASVAGAFTGIAAAFAGGVVVGHVKEFAEQLDHFDDLADQTGLATDALQLYSYAAKVSGSSSEEMAASLSLMQKSLGRTADAAAGPVVGALKDLGIATQDAAKQPRKLADVLPEVFAKFGALKSEAQQAQVATALFGRGGVKLLPTLRRGAAGLSELNAEMAEFGGPVAADTIAAAGKFRDDLVRLDTAMFALKGQLASGLFPQFSKLITGLAHGVGWLSGFVHQTTIASTALLAFGGAVALTFGKALAPYLGAGLKFAAIFLAVDDVIGFLQGKQSLIGELLDTLFGAGSSDGVRKWLIQAEHAIEAWVPKAVASISQWATRASDAVGQWYIAFKGWVDKALLTYRGFLAQGETATQAFVDTLSDPSFWVPIADAFVSVMAAAGEVIADVIEAAVRRALGKALAFAKKVVTHPLDAAIEAQDAGQQALQFGIDASNPTAAIGRKLLDFAGVNLGASAGRAAANGGGIGGAEIGTGLVDRGNAAREAARRLEASNATFVNPYQPGASNSVTVNTPITIQVPPGTPAQVVKEAGLAARDAVRNERRVAFEALAPRGGTP